MLEFRYAGGMTPMADCVYSFDLNQQQMLSLSCQLPEAHWHEVRPIIAEMAACLVID